MNGIFMIMWPLMAISSPTTYLLARFSFKIMLLVLLIASQCYGVAIQQQPILSKGISYQTMMTKLLFDKTDESCIQIQPIGEVQNFRNLNEAVVISRNSKRGVDLDQGEYLEIYGTSEAQIIQKMNTICRRVEADEFRYEDINHKDIKIIQLVKNGDPANRIDLVFMGDGYTLSQKGLFVKDMRRLVDDMFKAHTFASVLPLLNIWAIFVPSKESGIGSGGIPKDTAFGLYRDGTELRGIYPSKSNFARAVCKLTGNFACDYPAIIGNDMWYGGLGGEFVISTSCKTSGTVVLRHEMGHNMVSVGEEYDGGQVYDGVNASPSLDGLKWKHWLNNTEDVREELSAIMIQNYAWYDLEKGDYAIDFKSIGMPRWLLQVSSSGVETPDSLEVYLDGLKLSWNTTGTLDRAFSVWRGNNMTAGSHKLVFRQGYPPRKPNFPIRQLCSVTMHEFGSEKDYHTNNYIGAFPVWDYIGQKSYRPTNDFCLVTCNVNSCRCEICHLTRFVRFARKACGSIYWHEYHLLIP